MATHFVHKYYWYKLYIFKFYWNDINGKGMNSIELQKNYSTKPWGGCTGKYADFKTPTKLNNIGIIEKGQNINDLLV